MFVHNDSSDSCGFDGPLGKLVLCNALKDSSVNNGATGPVAQILVERNEASDVRAGLIMPESSLFDVCAYVIAKVPNISLTRLQLLVYYSYAWSLVWDEKELFSSTIQAGPNGPVIKQLYDYYKGIENLSQVRIGLPTNLLEDTRETIDAVIEGYQKFSVDQLVSLVQKELPWKKARGGIKTLDFYPTISRDDIELYYRSLKGEQSEEENT